MSSLLANIVNIVNIENIVNIGWHVKPGCKHCINSTWFEIGSFKIGTVMEQNFSLA